MWILLEIFVIVIYILTVMFSYKVLLKDISLPINNGDRLMFFTFSLMPISNIICCFVVFMFNYLEKKDEDDKNILSFLKFLEPKE